MLGKGSTGNCRPLDPPFFHGLLQRPAGCLMSGGKNSLKNFGGVDKHLFFFIVMIKDLQWPFYKLYQ